MRESFAAVDLSQKQPANDSRRYETWYLDLLFQEASKADEEEAQEARDYLRHQIIQNFNQNFLGWKPYKEGSPLDPYLARSAETSPVNVEGLGSHSRQLLTLMVEEPDIYQKFGISYPDLKQMTFSETEKLKKLLAYTKAIKTSAGKGE